MALSLICDAEVTVGYEWDIGHDLVSTLTMDLFTFEQYRSIIKGIDLNHLHSGTRFPLVQSMWSTYQNVELNSAVC